MDLAGLRTSRLVATLSSAGSSATASGWGLLPLCGRLTEISGAGASARLTAAVGLVHETQRHGERAVWIGLADSMFFPPDVADAGVDLGALVVVRVANEQAAARAADQLVRSGGFRLAVLDLDVDHGLPRVPPPLLNRLLGLAQKHHTAVALLTGTPATRPSLGSVISLRAEAVRELRGDRWEVRVTVLKDKRSPPGPSYVQVCRAPAGLR
jgi:recombination protein RecA